MSSKKGNAQPQRGSSKFTFKAVNMEHLNNFKKIAPPFSKSATYPDTSLDASQLPKDTQLSVVTNYIAVNKHPAQVHIYTIVLEPNEKKDASVFGSTKVTAPPTTQANNRPITRRTELKLIFQALLQRAPLLGRNDYATDYTTLWTREPLVALPTGNVDTQSYRINNFTYQKQSGSTVTMPWVDIRYVKTANFSNGATDLVGPTATHTNPSDLTRALNGMITRYISSTANNGLTEVGANKFFVNASWQDIRGLLVERGYFTSIRPGTTKPLLNVNITHATFLKPMLVSDFIDEMGHMSPRNDYGPPEGLLKGKTVRIIYDRPQTEGGVDRDDHRLKVIAGFGETPEKQTFMAEGVRWTVWDWFTRGDGATITKPKIPCVNVGLVSRPSDITTCMSTMGLKDAKESKDCAIWIPAEFLELEPNQPFGRLLGSTHMASMLGIALKRPASNHACIKEEGLPLLGIGNPAMTAALQKDLQLVTGKGLLHIPARILPPPTIQHGSGSEKVSKTPFGASWNLIKTRFLTSKPFTGPLKVFDMRSRPNNLRDYERTIEGRAPRGGIGLEYLQSARDHGMLPSGVNVTLSANLNIDALVKVAKVSAPLPQGSVSAFNQAFKTAYENLGSPQHMLVILQSDNAAIYGMVKTAAETQYGVKTTCITRDKIAKPGASLFSNLLSKDNLKLGGVNHGVMAGKLSAFAALGSDTLVLGADVVHLGGDLPSIAAMVGAFDQHFAKVTGSVRLQPAKVEILEAKNTKEMAEQHINAFVREKKKLPARVLYYRDGVGEDQYLEVCEKELPEIERAFITVRDRVFNNMSKDKLAITAVVVGKRHNTRFFPPKDSMSYVEKKGVNGNIKPGLIVDQIITMPDNPKKIRDFFLQSHAALAGTARSAHYVVVRNDPGSKLTFAHIQQLSHAFCYNFPRATKGVSYCAPAYYADRLCDRVHHYLKTWFLEVPARKQWTMTPTEQNMRPKEDGVLAFHRRVRDVVANDPTWNMSHTSGNPWHEKLNNSTFWV